jgi:hypothetical protein
VRPLGKRAGTGWLARWIRARGVGHVASLGVFKPIELLANAVGRPAAAGLHWNLGSVPDWFGGISLLLAFAIFAGDRRTRDRAQVDQVGLWFDNPGWTLGAAPEITANLTIRNTSQLPVTINEVAYEITPTWMGIPDGRGGIRSAEAPPMVGSRGFSAPLPPGENWPIEIKVSPHNGFGASGLGQVRCTVAEAQLIDNAGRTWLVRGNGHPARPYTWVFARRRQFQRWLSS